MVLHIRVVYKCIIETVIFSAQRSITQKVIKPDISCVLNVIFCCFTFFQGFKKIQIIERAKVYDWEHYLQCPEGSNSNAGNSRVMTLVFCTVIYICIKFQENKQFSSNRYHYFQCSKGHNSKSM